MKFPKISVVTISYGHENYITHAMNGVLMQDYPGEIEFIIADDSSPDNTQVIVEKYLAENKVSKNIVIKYTRHSVNKGMISNFEWTLNNSTGEYIAVCEGDDYWIDSLKLKKQIDFMEANDDCSICFHAAKYENTDNPNLSYIYRPKKIHTKNKFDIRDVILGGGGFITTNSMLFRREHILEMPEWTKEAPVADLPLSLILASKGKIGYLDDVMSVYRLLSSPHSWSNSMNNRNKERLHHQQVIKMWKNFDNWSDFKHHKIVLKKINCNNKDYFKNRLKGIIKTILSK